MLRPLALAPDRADRTSHSEKKMERPVALRAFCITG